MAADAPLLLLALERRLLAPGELEGLAGQASDPLVLAGHLVALGRVAPDALPALMSEAQARGRTCPRCARVSLRPATGPSTPCPGCGGGDSSTWQVATNAMRQTVLEPDRVLPLPGGPLPGREEAPTQPGSQGAALPSVPLPARLEPGARVGRYELIEELGRGAMGAVYRVQDEEGHELALKLLLGGAQASEIRRRRFEDELRLLIRLDHPHLIKVRDCGLLGGEHPFYVMDLRRGRDLRGVLRQGPLPPRAAGEIVARLARALEYAHERGVLHRDLKPENVLVDEALVPTLIDFGLAKDLELELGLTRTGMVLGTPFYMAPEQALGKVHQVDRRSDVWGLGVLLYELIAGQVPFTAQDARALTRKIVEDEPLPLGAGPGPDPDPLVPALEAVCLRALRKEPDRRWQGAGELAAALEAALAGAQAPAAGGSRRMRALVAAACGALLLGGAALLLGPRPASDQDQVQGQEHGAVATGSPGASGPSGSQAQPPDRLPPNRGLEAARALAAQGELDLALAELPAHPRESSFVRAERAALLRQAEGPAAHGLLLLGAAEAGRDRAAARAALELLQEPSCRASPAAQEGRARAALLLGSAEEAAVAADAALAAAPGDMEAQRAAARARAAALDARAQELSRLRLTGRPDTDGEAALATSWEEVAGALTQLRVKEPEGRAQDEARLWAGLAWTHVVVYSALVGFGGQGQRAPSVASAQKAGMAELAPLLRDVDVARIVAARRALVGVDSPEALEAREAELAAAAESVDRTALLAARLASRMGTAAARGWAEVWLAVAGDLPARALLAVTAAQASTEDPPRRMARMERALRLAPGLPLVGLERWRLALARGGLEAVLSPAGLREAAAFLAEAPQLLAITLLPLELNPLSPEQREVCLAALDGADRDTHLARALVGLYSRDPGPEALRQVAHDAAEAVALDPGCAVGHLLLAQALQRSGGEPQAVRRALACAEAAAPAWAEPHRARLASIAPDAWRSEDLEPLLLRGYLGRLPALLARGQPASEPPRIPAQVAALLGDARLDFSRSADRQALLQRLAATDHFPVLRLAVSLGAARARGAWTRSQGETLSAALLERLDPRSPHRWGAEAQGLLLQAEIGLFREQSAAGRDAVQAAVVRGYFAATTAGGRPWPLPGQLTAAAVPPRALDDLPYAAPPLPDAPDVSWTWFTGVCREDMFAGMLAQTIETQQATLSSAELAAQGSWGRVLVEAVQVDELQARAAAALLAGGERLEAHLALVRAGAFWPGPKDAPSALGERVDALTESLLASSTGSREDLRVALAVCEEALLRFGELPAERAVLSATQADVLLWLAGLEPAGSEEQRALLGRARAAADAIDLDLLGGEEPLYWTWWRRMRVHGAQGESEAAGQAARAATAELLRARGGQLWRRRAILNDPLRPLLGELPGYRELIEAATPPR